MKNKIKIRDIILTALFAVVIAVCYATGTLWFAAVYAKETAAIGLKTALMWCVVPFVIPDLIKITMALLLSMRLEKIVGKT